MAEKIRLLRGMTEEQLSSLRASARRSVEKSGALDLANYVIKVYRNALRERTRKNHPFRLYSRALRKKRKKLRLNRPRFKIHRKGDSESHV